MRKLFVLFAITVFAVSTSCSQTNDQVNNNQSGPKIEFEATEFDYGAIAQGSDGTCEFKFTNSGTEPLVLSNVQSTCGCTVPSWPKEPIKAGESSKIVVVYNTNRIGPINKSVSVSSNATSNAVVLRIKGSVLTKQVENNETGDK